MSYEGPSINTASAEYTGPVTKLFPLHSNYGDSAHCVFSQRYMQRWGDYTPPTLNASATFGGVAAYCVGDEGHSDVGAGIVEFTRRHANLPSAYFDYETVSITYPGFLGQREPVSQTSVCQIERAFYLVGAGQTYATPDALPLAVESRIAYAGEYNVSMFSGTTYLNNGGGVMDTSTPSLTAYLALVTGGTYALVIDSKPEQYMGGIWAVVTRRVKAK